MIAKATKINILWIFTILCECWVLLLIFFFLIFLCFRRMNNTFRIKISGKLEHIVTNMQSRLLNIPSTEPEMIQPHYHLTTLSLDKVKSLGFPTSEKTNANLLEFQMKLLVENGRGFLCGVSFAAWNDPYRQRHGMEWRMVEINLVKLSDPAAKLPPRYAGIIAVSLNTSYLQRQTNNKW